ncbi:425_t:CDS:1 [Dentiscutata heterogama]|uniref:425_t:CDS:1 n=1 Tax=Dentiscutata heterogama TaxID=1316150 RepID=A0ACA9K0E3_9GLOM|nr:425_t:CDS:1 [Dentiscutata heterogama]
MVLLAFELRHFSIPFNLEFMKPKSHSLTLFIKFSPFIRSLKSIFTPTTFLFSIPALAYFVNNNISFLILSIMNPPTFMVLGNLKIITTGLFYNIFLDKKLNRIQWIALLMLFLGSIISQIRFSNGGKPEIITSLFGFLLIVIFSCISAMASVYTEYIMSNIFKNESIHLQNIKLYLFGSLFNGLMYYFSTFSSFSSFNKKSVSNYDGFFSSLFPIHYLIIFSACSMGLITSAIIRYSGSITKIYSTSMAMFLSSFMSWIILDNYKPNILFFVGALLCCFSLQMYNNSKIENYEK